MCLQLLELDRDLGDFLAVLDRWNLDYAVALTADHGGLDIPERLRLHGVADAARIDPALTPKAGRRRGHQADRNCRARSSPTSASPAISISIRICRAPTGSERSMRRWRSIARIPQVAAAFSKDEIARDADADGRSGRLVGDPARPRLVRSRAVGRSLCRAQAAHHADRRHHRLCRDARQPVGLRPPRADPVLAPRLDRASTVERPVETTDIMPTLAAMIGLDARCRVRSTAIASRALRRSLCPSR